MSPLNHTSKFVSICALSALSFLSCTKNNEESISKTEMLKIVKDCEQQFSFGVQKKDSAILVNIYTDSAQYVQPNRKILVGKDEIGKEWAGFLRLKQQPVDLLFDIFEVRGSREIIYETGSGYTLLADSTRWNFNYVNVWRLQKDGSYKLEVDTYSPMD